MIIFDAQRASGSPYVERVWRAHAKGVEPFLSIAESRCELVLIRSQGKLSLLARGPETRATLLEEYPADGEWLGIRFKPGVSLANLPRQRARRHQRHAAGRVGRLLLAGRRGMALPGLRKRRYLRGLAGARRAARS
jgi:hypothetical protein